MTNTTVSFPHRQGTAPGIDDQFNTVGARVVTISTAATSGSFQSPPNCRILRATAFVRNAVATAQAVQIGTTGAATLYGTVAVSAVGAVAVVLTTAINNIQSSGRIVVRLTGSAAPTTGVVDVVIEVISSSAV